MGVSTNGQICFGILFEEDYEFPWNTEKYSGNAEEWWIYEICNYKNPLEVYDESGEYIGGIRPSEEKISEYFDTKKAFAQKHPLPIELVNYCSHDCEMYILAVPKTCKQNFRGSPEIFEPQELIVSDAEIQELIIFCKKYCQAKDEFSIFPEMKPKWFLSSFWG